ncbi:MAG: DUF885 family protein [Bryobacteraceae bacterium]
MPAFAGPGDSMVAFSTDFWIWRARYQPFSQDDIPRVEHPPGQRDWSASAIAKQREELKAFDGRWKSLPHQTLPVSEQVDYRLLGSALARVHWELEINKRWERDPTFYVDQAITGLLEALLPPPPFTAERTRQIMERMENIPALFRDGMANLHPAKPFAELALGELRDIRPKLTGVAKEVAPMLTATGGKSSEALTSELIKAAADAATAAEAYRTSLEKNLQSYPAKSAVGRENYVFFLRNIALVPFTPEQLLSMSRQEWSRAVAFEQYEHQRDLGNPELPLASSFEDQRRKTEIAEQAIRNFLTQKQLLTMPADIPHYVVKPIPSYLSHLEGFGELDDFTSLTRLKEEGLRWTPKPSPALGYFALATAKDPRPLIIHEGVPGHYFQMSLSWRNPDPVRRAYYDSGANEGIGFYAEEMMLQAGLFDDSPRSREIIYNFMRLRALRVEVDVKLALGEFSIDQGAEYLAKSVPMDAETAHEEARLFASTPGQAITYQIGKIQITRLLADARTKQGNAFRLQAFHDYVWKNGNVPLSLQRWEYLASAEEVPALAP